MARYVTKVRSPWAPDRAFAFMADLTNFVHWDPGVKAAEQTVGSGGGPDAVFEVTVAGWPRELLLSYRTVEHRDGEFVRAVAETSMLVSDDRITVSADGAGSIVEYDADLRLKGALAVADWPLRLAFKRIGDRAAAGLRVALEGSGA